MIRFVIRYFLFMATGALVVYAQDQAGFPLYEDYIESGNLNKYLQVAGDFLDENPDVKEAPRVALDLIMMGKLTENPKSVVRGTDLLLFKYLGSLPSLYFISSFDRGSPKLTQLLKIKIDSSDFNQKEFADSFANAIVLIARIHGPQLMSDPSLLLRTYLILKGCDKKELVESLEKAIDVWKEKNTSFKDLIEICNSENTTMEKIFKLREMNHPDAGFCIEYFTASLSENEKSSPLFMESTIQSALFSESPKSDLALTYLSNLPSELSTSPKYQTYTALAHLLKGNVESAQTLLKTLIESQANSSNDWVETARSLNDGTQFGDSRKALLLEQLEKLYDRLQTTSKYFLIEGSWIHPLQKKCLNFQIGVDKEKEKFEIHFQQNNKAYFSYQISKDDCKIFMPSGKNISFTTTGVYPLPKVEIKRDSENGSFHYSFNLNFDPKFDIFLSQVVDNMKIPYLSSSKGREVLLNYLLKAKGMWLSQPASTDRGTVFILHKIDPILSSKQFKIEMSGNGRLVSLDLGRLNISSFSEGTGELMNKLPNWPNISALEKKNEFDPSLIIEAIGDLIELASSGN